MEYVIHAKPYIFFRFIQIVFFLISILAGCRKDGLDEVSVAQTRIGASFPDLIYSIPGDGDTGVSHSANITILTKDRNKLPQIRNGLITVNLNGDAVDGMVVQTDSGMHFVPDHDLLPNATYTVEASGVVVFTPDYIKPGVASSTYRNSWQFTTKGPAIYHMEGRSQSVTNFARDGNKIMQIGQYLYSYGGWSRSPNRTYSDVYRSDGDLTEWHRMPDAPWPGRHTFGIGMLDTTLYVFGGDHQSAVFDVWKSTDGLHFTEVAHDLSAAMGMRTIYGAGVHRNKLFVMGGQRSLAPDVGVTDVWTSSDGFVWNQIASDLAFLGKNLSGVVTSFNDRIWVVGGGYYDHPVPSERWTNHVYSSPDGVNWRQEPDAPWTGRQYADICVWDNKLWMVGGHNGSNLADIWYMEKGGTWTKFEAPSQFEPRHASALGVYNNQLVIVCGNYHNDCWVIEKLY